MDKLTGYALDALKKPYSLQALVGLNIVSMVFLSGFHNFFKIFLSLDTLKYVYLISIFLLNFRWSLGRFRLPRKKAGKINIVISIGTEDDASAEILKKDLIDSLQKNFATGNISDMTHVISLPSHFAEKIKNHDEVKKKNEKIKAHMWIWGHVKRRGGVVYLDLEGYVTHRRIYIKTSNKLGKDFRTVLPPRIQFSENLSFQGSEITAGVIYYATSYITGVAALISGAPDVTLKMHRELQQQISTNPKKLLSPNISFILSKLPITISEAYITKAIFYLNKKNDVSNSKKELENAFKANPKSYSALIFRSILEFSIDKDPIKAIATTKEAEERSEKDITWKYNIVFLLLWAEDFENAIKFCRSIERHDDERDRGISLEVMEFIKEIIKKENTKPQLYYWLGFLSYKKLKNTSLALKYFEKFLNTPNRNTDVLKNQVLKWIQELESIKKNKKTFISYIFRLFSQKHTVSSSIK